MEYVSFEKGLEILSGIRRTGLVAQALRRVNDDRIEKCREKAFAIVRYPLGTMIVDNNRTLTQEGDVFGSDATTSDYVNSSGSSLGFIVANSAVDVHSSMSPQGQSRAVRAVLPRGHHIGLFETLSMALGAKGPSMAGWRLEAGAEQSFPLSAFGMAPHIRRMRETMNLAHEKPVNSLPPAEILKDWDRWKFLTENHTTDIIYLHRDLVEALFSVESDFGQLQYQIAVDAFNDLNRVTPRYDLYRHLFFLEDGGDKPNVHSVNYRREAFNLWSGIMSIADASSSYYCLSSEDNDVFPVRSARSLITENDFEISEYFLVPAMPSPNNCIGYMPILNFIEISDINKAFVNMNVWLKIIIDVMGKLHADQKGGVFPNWDENNFLESISFRMKSSEYFSIRKDGNNFAKLSCSHEAFFEGKSHDSKKTAYHAGGGVFRNLIKIDYEKIQRIM